MPPPGSSRLVLLEAQPLGRTVRAVGSLVESARSSRAASPLVSSSLGVKAKAVGLTGAMMDNRETALNAALKLHEGRVTSADELIAAATKIDKYLSRTDDGDSVEPRRPEVNYIQHFEPTATGDEAARIYTMFRGVADQRDHAVEIAGVIIAPCDPFGRTTL